MSFIIQVTKGALNLNNNSCQIEIEIELLLNHCSNFTNHIPYLIN